MIKKEGVYTTKCSKCSRSIVIHVSSDGSISPDKCKECFLEFECIEYGEQRNTFIVIPKTKKSAIFVNDRAEETNKTDDKSFGGQSFTLETSKKSSKNKTGKKSFGW